MSAPYLIEYVKAILGDPPVNDPMIVYIVTAALFLVVLMSCVSFISGIFKYLGGL